MKNLIIDNLISKIKINTNYDDIKIQEIRYGLLSIYLTFTKIILIAVICALLNIFKEFLLFMIFFSALRSTCFGLHTKKTYQCYIFSIMFFVGFPYLIKYYVINKLILYITLPIYLLMVILFAPADTEKRPLIHSKKRKIYKIISIITSTIYIITILIIKNTYIISLLYYSLLLITLVINPLSYKLLGLKYNNYKERSKK